MQKYTLALPEETKAGYVGSAHLLLPSLCCPSGISQGRTVRGGTLLLLGINYGHGPRLPRTRARAPPILIAAQTGLLVSPCLPLRLPPLLTLELLGQFQSALSRQ